VAGKRKKGAGGKAQGRKVVRKEGAGQGVGARGALEMVSFSGGEVHDPPTATPKRKGGKRGGPQAGRKGTQFD